MKTNTLDSMMLAPREERAILNQIRNDHELRDRLGITPQELEALSKCALLGTLTCKEDMLFILRQIREASCPSIAEMSVFAQPARFEAEQEEDPAPSFRDLRNRIRPAIVREPLMIDGPVSRRLPKRFGVLLVMVFAAAALLWKGATVVWHWRDSLMATIGSLVTRVPALDGRYDHFDRFGVLLSCEALLVVSITAVLYLRSVKSYSRLKVRPGRGY